MPVVQAKCPNCGGMLAVDNGKKAAICDFCGDAYIVEEAINNYITYNITNNVTDNSTHQHFGDGAVVNIYENKSEEFVVVAGVLKEYKGSSVDVVIPNNVHAIGEACFEGLEIRSVVMPSSVIEVKKRAFAECDQLASITIHGDFVTIGDGAFEDCDALETLDLQGSISKIGNRAFAYCNSLTYIALDNCTFEIGESAFDGCFSLADITIPNSITKISRSAFSCTDISTLEIPNSVKVIESNAFSHCTNLSMVTIPDSVEEIEMYAFYGCTELSSVTMPNGIKIGTCAFDNTPYYEKIAAKYRAQGRCQHCGGEIIPSMKMCCRCGIPKDY